LSAEIHPQIEVWVPLPYRFEDDSNFQDIKPMGQLWSGLMTALLQYDLWQRAIMGLVSCGVVGAVVFAGVPHLWQLPGKPPVEAPASKQSPATASFVKDLRVHLEGSGSEKLLLLDGFAAVTADRIRVFLDYARPDPLTGVPIGAVEKVKIGELREIVKGQALKLPVTTKQDISGTTERFWFGAPNELRGNSVGRGFNLARLILLGTDNQQQDYYFVLVQADVREGSERFLVLQGEQFNFASTWAQKDK
jgi:hypothetical protein